MNSDRFILLKVKVEHDPGADVDDICRQVEVVCDAEDGAINESEVVLVADKMKV